ncbi:zinc dependent phospholipase C family protein [Emticicia sp. SJ17W-69]|uniref:zinc dependent phospholipase C family protein n=1 Tax=Emticicia sp. SJ17W-69 TaxID=3421657 RepID=UPI003EBC38F9
MKKKTLKSTLLKKTINYNKIALRFFSIISLFILISSWKNEHQLQNRPLPLWQLPLWGFFAHQQINRLAVFTLPPEMFKFYKKNIDYISENAVNPDERRYSVKAEAPRHFIDLDNYSDSLQKVLPNFSWKDVTERIGEDTLNRHGIVPWHINLMKYQLTEAFRNKNVHKILMLSADIGHYIADANVPLHTTRNYNGQFSNQVGIHGFWESRLPEMFAENYDFFIGQAEYVKTPQKRAWQAVMNAHAALDSVLIFERELTNKVSEDKKFSFDERNGVTIRTYSKEFSTRYHTMLKNQVERQMRTSIKMVGDFWLTCWIDAGQPDLSQLIDYKLTQEEKEAEETEKKSWLQRTFDVRKEN